MTTPTRTLLVVAVVLLAPLAAAGSVAAQPDPPAEFYGSATVDGEPAPEGTTVQAVLGDEVVDETTVDGDGQYGGPDPLDDRLTVQCSDSESNTVEFQLASGVTAEETATCTSGSAVEIDLTFPETGDDPGEDPPEEDPPEEDPPEEDPPEEDPPEEDPGNGDDGDDGNGGDDAGSGGNGGAAGGGGGGGGATGGADDGASIDVTSLDDGATVSIDDVPTGEDVEADLGDAVAGEGVTLQSLTFDYRITPDDYRVEITEVGAEPTGSADELTRAEAIGYLDIEPIGTDQIESTEIGFTVEDDALADGAAADAVRLYRYDDGWEQLETDHVGSSGDVHEFVAVTDGFSSFAVGTATADVTVTDAALSDEQVIADEPATVTATVENDGDVEGSATLALTVDGEQRDEIDVSVPAGEQTDVTFTTALDEPGEYAVAVDEVTAGDLSVVESAASAESDDDSIVEEQAPGFGVLAAAIALLALGLLARRR